MKQRKTSGWGGWRPGAGRKKKPGAISHGARPDVTSRAPVRVTMQVIAGLPSLARHGKRIADAVRATHEEAGAGREPVRAAFRIVEHRVTADRIELVAKAASRDALSRGMAAFAVRVAKRLNGAFGRSGKLWAHRYQVKSAR